MQILKDPPQIKQAIDYFRNLILDKLSEETKDNCWIAGGAIRDYFSEGRFSDIDLYFKNSNYFELVKVWFELHGAEKIFDNEFLTVFIYEKVKYDLVKRYFLNPQSTIKQFDFTVCCATIDTKALYCHDTFFIDLAKRRLVINALPYPLSTLQRLQKYILKGYLICNEGFLQIAKALQGIDFESIEQNHIEFYPDGRIRFIRFD